MFEDTISPAAVRDHFAIPGRAAVRAFSVVKVRRASECDFTISLGCKLSAAVGGDYPSRMLPSRALIANSPRANGFCRRNGAEVVSGP